MYKFVLVVPAIQVAESAAEKVEGAGADAVVGALRGGVMVHELEGEAKVAIVEGESPVDVAVAEGLDVLDPADAVTEEDEAVAEDGIGVLTGEG